MACSMDHNLSIYAISTHYLETTHALLRNIYYARSLNPLRMVFGLSMAFFCTVFYTQLWDGYTVRTILSVLASLVICMTTLGQSKPAGCSRPCRCCSRKPQTSAPAPSQLQCVFPMSRPRHSPMLNPKAGRFPRYPAQPTLPNRRERPRENSPKSC